MDLDPESAARAADAVRTMVKRHEDALAFPDRFPRPKRGIVALYKWIHDYGFLDATLSQLQGERIIPYSEIMLWRHKVRGTTPFSREKALIEENPRKRRWLLRYRNALSPPCTTRPNPCLARDLVIASLFSPGRIRAVDRSTGETVGLRRWTTTGRSLSFSMDKLIRRNQQ